MVIIDGGHLTNLAFDSVVRNRDVERTELFANYDILPGRLLQAGAIKRNDNHGVLYAVRIAAAWWSSNSSIAISRSRNFWTLPVTVIGKSSAKRTYRGIL